MPWFQSVLQVYGFQIGALILIVGILIQFGPTLLKYVKIPNLSSLGTPALTESQQAFAAVEHLQNYFTKRGCDEGKKAAEACLLHFFRGPGSN